MRARLTRLMAGLTLVAALAFGGATLAGAAGKANPAPPAPPAAVDVQQGDQTAPDVGGKAAESAAESASEASESASESASSESAAESDGPGGYADTNPNADTQFQGEQ